MYKIQCEVSRHQEKIGTHDSESWSKYELVFVFVVVHVLCLSGHVYVYNMKKENVRRNKEQASGED